MVAFYSFVVLVTRVGPKAFPTELIPTCLALHVATTTNLADMCSTVETGFRRYYFPQIRVQT